MYACNDKQISTAAIQWLGMVKVATTITTIGWAVKGTEEVISLSRQIICEICSFFAQLAVLILIFGPVSCFSCSGWAYPVEAPLSQRYTRLEWVWLKTGL